MRRDNERLKGSPPVADREVPISCDGRPLVEASRGRIQDADLELNDLEQKQDQDDGEDERETAAAVVSDARAEAVTAETEEKNEDDEKDQHGGRAPINFRAVVRLRY